MRHRFLVINTALFVVACVCGSLAMSFAAKSKSIEINAPVQWIKNAQSNS